MESKLFTYIILRALDNVKLRKQISFSNDIKIYSAEHLISFIYFLQKIFLFILLFNKHISRFVFFLFFSVYFLFRRTKHFDSFVSCFSRTETVPKERDCLVAIECFSYGFVNNTRAAHKFDAIKWITANICIVCGLFVDSNCAKSTSMIAKRKEWARIRKFICWNSRSKRCWQPQASTNSHTR